MSRSANAWMRSSPAPHKHQLPRGLDFGSAANDRKCVPHGGTEIVKCAIGDCQHTFGKLCDKCGKVC